MLCQLLVQGAEWRREIANMCGEPLDRLLDEIQLATPDRLNSIKSQPIRLHDGLDVPALARKYRLDLGSRERQPIMRRAEYHKPALVRARVCHGSLHSAQLIGRRSKATAFYSLAGVFIYCLGGLVQGWPITRCNRSPRAFRAAMGAGRPRPRRRAGAPGRC